MKSIQRVLRNGVVIERVDLLRATINEAAEIKDNLLDDIDFKKIIIDLSTCNYIDSTFFGALVFAHRLLKDQDCLMVLVISETVLSQSFIFNEITSVFKVYHSIREAIEALNENSSKTSDDNCAIESKKETVKIVQPPLQLNQE